MVFIPKKDIYIQDILWYGYFIALNTLEKDFKKKNLVEFPQAGQEQRACILQKSCVYCLPPIITYWLHVAILPFIWNQTERQHRRLIFGQQYYS